MPNKLENVLNLCLENLVFKATRLFLLICLTCVNGSGKAGRSGLIETAAGSAFAGTWLSFCGPHFGRRRVGRGQSGDICIKIYTTFRNLHS